MKSNEFLNEGLTIEYDTILQNLLKKVMYLKKHPERKATKLSINELLYDLGVNNNWDVRTHDHPLSQQMRQEARKFINAVTHGFTDDSFNKYDIKHFADTLYNWSQAVNDMPKKDFQ